MLVTTTIKYDLSEENKTVLKRLLGLNDIETWTNIIVTDKEYLKYWYLFDKIQNVREENASLEE